MAIKLNLFTWNTTGIMSSCSYLSEILVSRQIDVCGVSEHWLYDNNLNFFNTINSQYSSYAVADNDLRIYPTHPTGKGGVAILWNRRLNNSVTCLPIECDRIIGIQIEMTPDNFIFIFQVYLPTKAYLSDCFKQYLEILEHIVYIYSQRGIVIFMGDFNCHVNTKTFIKPLDCRDTLFMQFLDINRLSSVSSLDICDGENATFVSTCGSSCIDHIVIPTDDLNWVESCTVIGDQSLLYSNHRPIICKIAIPECVNKNRNQITRINWKNVTQEQKDIYRYGLDSDCGFSAILSLKIININDIDQIYKMLINTLNNMAALTLNKSKFFKYQKPYWNRYLTELSKSSKISRNIWLNSNRPDYGAVYDNYKSAKRTFRREHRKAVDNHLNHVIDEIDKAAEVDHVKFWQLVNKNRKQYNQTPGAEINFNGKDCRGNQEILKGWESYFKELYDVDNDATFDTRFADLVSVNLRNLMSNNISKHKYYSVTIYDINNALKHTKRNKAPGIDMITYEHLRYGGSIVRSILAKLFSAMIKFSHVPVEMKTRVIFTVFKGGNKDRKNPNSYRAITLSSTIFKLFESVILTYINNRTPIPTHKLQGGFQSGIGCMMSSLALNECIQFAKEQNSKLYACFLDCRQAFDRVWHDGLFYKLCTYLETPLLKCVIAMYNNSYSKVRCNGVLSEPIPIQQGTRQGGISSPTFYLLYIHDLIVELDNSGYGLSISGKSCSSLSVADDMVLLSYSRNGLQKLIDICYSYSCKWRFKYNPQKCSIIVFNESKRSYKLQTRAWKMGNDDILESENYIHLGIGANKYMKHSSNIETASKRLRSGLMSFADIGICKTNPTTGYKIYTCVIVPRALYGCEIWPALNTSMMQMIEKSHRFCLKYIQNVPSYIRTDVCTSLIGSRNICYELDKRKLTFLGQLCRLSVTHISRCIFLYRLVSYYRGNYVQQGGFVPEIVRVVRRYSLENYLHTFLESGVFPNKVQWKSLVSRCIDNKAEDEWIARVTENINLTGLISIKNSSDPFIIWELCKRYHILKKYCVDTVVVLCRLFSDTFTQICPYCLENVQNIVEHLFTSCAFHGVRRIVIHSVIMQEWGNNIYSQFLSLSPRMAVIALLTGMAVIIPNLDKNISFLKKIIKLLTCVGKY